MRAYWYKHAAIICPTCCGLLPNVSGPVADDEFQTVACVNPKCPELGKHKHYARQFVELIDGDQPQKQA